MGPQNAMGFHLLAGPEVTVVASKSSQRYRLQSESFPAIAVVLEELVARLVDHHAGKVCGLLGAHVMSCDLYHKFGNAGVM